MKVPVDHLARFSPGAYYHVFNRTNNREPLFVTDENRRFFLKQYKKFLSPYVDTFAWCLMDNHFHLSIRIKPAALITEVIQQIPGMHRIVTQERFLEMPVPERDFHEIIERQFTRLFTVYAMAINRQFGRSGNLFYRPFKRIAVNDENHLMWLIYYIHANISRHGVLPDFTSYLWSSYPAFLSDQLTHLCKQEVLDWFGGLKGFLDFHQPTKDFPGKMAFMQLED